jgi:hypothetical protein
MRVIILDDMGGVCGIVGAEASRAAAERRHKKCSGPTAQYRRKEEGVEC